jgi:hypothetical protein
LLLEPVEKRDIFITSSRLLSSGAKSVYTYDNGGWLNGQKHLDATGATIVD